MRKSKTNKAKQKAQLKSKTTKAKRNGVVEGGRNGLVKRKVGATNANQKSTQKTKQNQTKQNPKRTWGNQIE